MIQRVALLTIALAAGVNLTPPGAINSAVTQANIGQTICVPGWTKTVRPPAAYTNALKTRQIVERHLPGLPRDYEEDQHLHPVAVAGVVALAIVCPRSMAPNYAPPTGAINPQITQANIAETICVRGWTRTVRPPLEYTSALKRQQMTERHLPGALPITMKIIGTHWT